MNKTKYLKIIPILLLSVFLLTGCVSLQDLKDSHAIWKDSAKQTVIWKGQEYQYLMNNKESTFYIDMDVNITLKVTTSDVPTLLKRYLGDYAIVSKDTTFLCVDSDVYCRQDKYDELKTRIQEGDKMEFYASQYSRLVEDGSAYDTLLHVFTDEERILLDKIDGSCSKKNVNLNVFWDESEYITDMYLVSEDGLFREYRGIGLYRTKNREYYWEKCEQDDYVLYAIPDEYIGNIEALFADEIEAAEKNAEYTEEY